jgi:hypothetical protein
LTKDAVKSAAEKAYSPDTQENPDIVILCARSSQFALGFSGGNMDRLKNVGSLAASLDLPFQSFIGRFKIADSEGTELWWVLAMVDGEIIGGLADTCYDTAEEADRAIAALKSLNQRKKFEEERTCEDIEGSSRYLEQFLVFGSLRSYFSIDSKAVPLAHYAQRKQLLAAKILGLGFLAFVGWYSSDTVGEFVSSLFLYDDSAAAHERRAELRRYYTDNPEKLFSTEWQSSPSVRDIAEPCIVSIQDTPLIMSGWLLEAADCRRQRASVHIERTYAHTPFASYYPLSATSRVDPRFPRILRDRHNIPVTASFPWRSLTWKELPEGKLIDSLFLQIAQTFRVDQALTRNHRERKHVEDAGEITCPWAKWDWEIKLVPPSTILDGSLIRILKSVPGLVVDNMSVDRSGYWKISGKIYVR